MQVKHLIRVLKAQIDERDIYVQGSTPFEI